MPTGQPNPQSPPEEFDPDQTLFFSRRKRRVNLLPFIVGCILVLGSGALLAYVLTHSNRKPLDEPIPTATPKDPYANRPILSPEEARSLDNPPVATPAPAGNIATGTPMVPDATPVPTASPVASSGQSQTPPPAVPADDSMPVRRALPVNTGSAAPPADDSGNGPINLDVTDSTNALVRTEVLRRIDLMPGVSQSNKDKLYGAVDHARKMGRVLTVPFDKGESVVRNETVEHLKGQLQTPAIQALLDDPTMVFVVLGYADQKGSGKINSDISLSRARSVMDALRDKCGLQNVMHSVAMGGSTLFSAQQVEKNRVVEIWAVLP